MSRRQRATPATLAGGQAPSDAELLAEAKRRPELADLIARQHPELAGLIRRHASYRRRQLRANLAG